MSELTLPLWAAVPAAILLIFGGLLALIGSIGLLRMRSFYARMHPPTMGATLGSGCVLVASMLVSSALLQRPVIHEVLITVFVLITAPVSAMTLMRAALSRTRDSHFQSGVPPGSALTDHSPGERS
jgi:multicomponent K+:H+ antiporter subunit G